MQRNQTGFTLIEVTVVVVMLGILAVIVAPRFASARTDTRITAASEDIHTIIEAIELFKANKGYWPVDTITGVVPPEINTAFKGDNPFKKPTPIGGIYDYENISTDNVLRLSIRPTRTTPAPQIIDALALDEFIDDGVLTTGRFRSTSGGGYTYIFSKR